MITGSSQPISKDTNILHNIYETVTHASLAAYLCCKQLVFFTNDSLQLCYFTAKPLAVFYPPISLFGGVFLDVVNKKL